MAGLVTLFNQTATLQGFQITNPTDMLSALTYLTGLTPNIYTGAINCQTVNGTVTYSLSIYDAAQNTSQTAYVNDWVILTGGVRATVCKAAQFATFYHT